MTITVLLGDGSGARQQVSDAQTAANLFVGGGQILTMDAAGHVTDIYQPAQIAGSGNNPDGWLIHGVTATDYFATQAPQLIQTSQPSSQPTVSTGVISIGKPIVSGGGDGVATPTGQPIYRLILPEPDGTFATGANYPGCSKNATNYCDPQSFPSLKAAAAYAIKGNEIPVIVSDEQEAWDIVAGLRNPTQAEITAAIPPSGVTPIYSGPPTPTPGGTGTGPIDLGAGPDPNNPYNSPGYAMGQSILSGIFSSPIAFFGVIGGGLYLLFRKK